MDIKIVDLHNDLLTEKDYSSAERDFKKAEKSGYKSIYAIYRGDKTLSYVKQIIKKAKQFGVKNIAFEDSGYTESEDFESFISELKPLYASLCWNDKNRLGSGCKAEGGLTKDGKGFIQLLNRQQIPLDLAHVNERTFYNAVDIADRVICSHTAFNFDFKNPRNIDREQIDIILSKGGIIGVCFVGYFLSKQKNNGDIKCAESAFYGVIDRYLQIYGVEGLAIGSDFNGSDFLAFLSYEEFLYSFSNRFLSRGGSEYELDRIIRLNAINYFKNALQ